MASTSRATTSAPPSEQDRQDPRTVSHEELIAMWRRRERGHSVRSELKRRYNQSQFCEMMFSKERELISATTSVATSMRTLIGFLVMGEEDIMLNRSSHPAPGSESDHWIPRMAHQRMGRRESGLLHQRYGDKSFRDAIWKAEAAYRTADQLVPSLNLRCAMGWLSLGDPYIMIPEKYQMALASSYYVFAEGGGLPLDITRNFGIGEKRPVNIRLCKENALERLSRPGGTSESDTSSSRTLSSSISSPMPQLSSEMSQDSQRYRSRQAARRNSPQSSPQQRGPRTATIPESGYGPSYFQPSRVQPSDSRGPNLPASNSPTSFLRAELPPLPNSRSQTTPLPTPRPRATVQSTPRELFNEPAPNPPQMASEPSVSQPNTPRSQGSPQATSQPLAPARHPPQASRHRTRGRSRCCGGSKPPVIE